MNIRFKGFLDNNIFGLIVVSCCLLTFSLIEIYIAKFRSSPLYAESANINCSKASIVVKKQTGGRFSSRDRKFFLLESGDVIRASLNIKLPVIDGADINSDYYRALLNNDFDGYYICYVLIEDQILNDNSQIVYISKYVGQKGLSKEYIAELDRRLNVFNQETDENGWWVYMEIFVLLNGMLVGVAGLVFQKSLNNKRIKFDNKENK